MTNPFVHHDRKRFTPQERARIYASRNGCCHKCKRKLWPGDKWVLEHVIALENGGTNELENMHLTCDWCVPAKNGEDHAKAGKARRAFTKHNVPREFTRSQSWSRR